jgi:hypothetical protein
MPATQLLALYRGKQLSPHKVIEHTMPMPAAYADLRADDLPSPSNARNWVTYTRISVCCTRVGRMKKPPVPFGRARTWAGASGKIARPADPAVEAKTPAGRSL